MWTHRIPKTISQNEGKYSDRLNLNMNEKQEAKSVCLAES